MGFLHAGHLSLVQKAKELADVVVVSIYVNPEQFAPTEDLGIYPRDMEGDLKKLLLLGVDAVFNPHDLYVRDAKRSLVSNDGVSISRDSTLYTVDQKELNDCNDTKINVQPSASMCYSMEQGHETWVRVERLEVPLCGQSRPGFFRGVATVVAKIFNIVEPDLAVFGKKDYQQWRVIHRMVRDLDFAIEIIGCELLREPDGLAMSSRNVLLSPTERVQALSINTSLRKVEAAVRNGTTNVNILIDSVRQAIVEAGGKVDYVEIVDQDSLRHLEFITCAAVLCVAAWFGSVRLIDNTELQSPQCN